MDKDSKTILTKWLDAIQQESWQLELLISGFAIFGLYAAKTPSYEFLLSLVNTLDPSSIFSRIVVIFVFGIPISIEILILNLLVHVVLRGIWIGTIGLRYVSKEIDYDNLNYSSRFDDFARKSVGDFDDYIEKLEKVCSIIFAYSFLLVFLILSFLFFIIPVLIFGSLLSVVNENKSLLNKYLIYYGLISYMMCGLITFVDLVFGGLFRKSKDPVIGMVYLPIYRFIGIVTLSFLYRPILYNFLDNKYTKRVLLLTIPYFLIASLISLSGFNVYTHFPSSLVLDNYGTTKHYFNYEDQLIKHGLPDIDDDARHEVHKIVFSNYILENNYPSLFVKWEVEERNYFTEEKDIKGFTKSGYYFFEPKELQDSSHQYYFYSNLLDSLNEINVKDSLLLYNLEQEKAIIRVSLHENSSIDRNPKLDKEKQILSLYREMLNIKIDEVVLDDSKLRSLFHTYPNTEYKGVMIALDMSNIEPGFHDLSFSKLVLETPDSLGFETIKIPFIKPEF